MLPDPWRDLMPDLAALWGALILAFVAGVRRGFGFGAPDASTRAELVAMLVYFVPAGVALLLAWVRYRLASLLLLAAGYALVGLLDARAARRGDAPAHFALLRPVQMMIPVLSLIALAVR